MRNKILISLLIVAAFAVGLSVVLLGSKTIQTQNQQTVQPETTEEPFKKPIEGLTSLDPIAVEGSLSKTLIEKIGEERLNQNLKIQKDIFGEVTELTFINEPTENPDGTVTVEVAVKFEKAERPIISQVILIKEEWVWKILSTDLLSP